MQSMLHNIVAELKMIITTTTTTTSV